MLCLTCGQSFPLQAPATRPQVSPVSINIYLQPETSILPASTLISFAVVPTADVSIGHNPIGHGPVGHDPFIIHNFLHDFIPVPVSVNPEHTLSAPEHALPSGNWPKDDNQ
jgi:hypothetical protein